MKIKRLNLEGWMEDYAMGSLGMFKHEHHKYLYESEVAYFQEKYPVVGFSAFPNGCYIHGAACYFVYNGYAFCYDKQAFNYRLKQISNLEKVSNPEKLKALVKLEEYVYGKARDESVDMLRTWLSRESIRRMRCMHILFRGK